MTFSVSWHTLLEDSEDLPADAVLVTPLSQIPFQITETQEHRIVIDYVEKDETRPLQREQLETLFHRIGDDPSQAFNLDRLPPDVEPFAAVWSQHPRMAVDEDASIIRQTDLETTTRLAITGIENDNIDRYEQAADGADRLIVGIASGLIVGLNIDTLQYGQRLLEVFISVHTLTNKTGQVGDDL